MSSRDAPEGRKHWSMFTHVYGRKPIDTSSRVTPLQQGEHTKNRIYIYSSLQHYNVVDRNVWNYIPGKLLWFKRQLINDIQHCVHASRSRAQLPTVRYGCFSFSSSSLNRLLTWRRLADKSVSRVITWRRLADKPVLHARAVTIGRTIWLKKPSPDLNYYFILE